jgi:hypothetical protein
MRCTTRLLLYGGGKFLLIPCSFSSTHQNLQDRHFRRRTPQCYCLLGGADVPTSAARDNNKPALLIHSQVYNLPMQQTPAGTATVSSWHCKLPDNTGQQHGSTTPALLNGSTDGVRGVGPIQLAALTSVRVGNNQQNCKLFPERKTYIPGSFARIGFPLGNFIQAKPCSSQPRARAEH